MVVILVLEIDSLGHKMAKWILVMGLTNDLFAFTGTDSSSDTDSLVPLLLAPVLRSAALLSSVCQTDAGL